MDELNGDRGRLGAAVSTLALIVVGVYLVNQRLTGYIADPVFIVGCVALVCWLGLVLIPRTRVLPRGITTSVMIVAAALSTAPTNGLMVVTVVVGVLSATASSANPAWFGPVLALIAAGLIPLGALAVTIAPTGILSLEAGVLVALLGGMTRRQSRERQRQASELLERTAQMREEQAKASVLASKQTLARDLHDVLAHSLGGLVIQLDAVDALLEAGSVDEAGRRVRDARMLAASGLGDARRAVDALRGLTESDEPDEPDSDLARALRELVDAHTRLGGAAELTERGAPHDLSAAVSTALRRTLQEALSNARKHAQGEPVTADLEWGDWTVRLRVSNPIARESDGVAHPAHLSESGGRNGLRGMSERFEGLPGGRVTAGVRDDRFVVEAEAAMR